MLRHEPLDITPHPKDILIKEYFAENRNKALRGLEDGLRLDEMVTVKKFAAWLEERGCLKKAREKGK